MAKFKCSECDWQGQESEVLRAPNPFSEDDETMIGCPDCRQPETMRVVCVEAGCWKEAGCGINTPHGYRVVCSEHFQMYDKMLRPVVVAPIQGK